MDLQEHYLNNPKINAFDISIEKGQLFVFTHFREDETPQQRYNRHVKNISTARKIFKRI